VFQRFLIFSFGDLGNFGTSGNFPDLRSSAQIRGKVSSIPVQISVINVNPS